MTKRKPKSLKVRPPRTPVQLDYGLRRVINDIMVGAKAVWQLTGNRLRRDFSGQEIAKFAGLIVARNLNDFFFQIPDKDDVAFLDFGLTSWTPDPKAELSHDDKPDKKLGDRNRIGKLYGHIVAVDDVEWDGVEPYRSPEAINTIRPLLLEGCHFVRECSLQKGSQFKGKARFYIRRLNGTLNELGLPGI